MIHVYFFFLFFALLVDVYLSPNYYFLIDKELYLTKEIYLNFKKSSSPPTLSSIVEKHKIQFLRLRNPQRYY